MERRPTTLVEFIIRRQQAFPKATGAFTMLVEGLSLAAKIVSREVNQAGLSDHLGLTGHKNIQGEQVARLDEFANDTFVRTLTRTGSVCALASEELAVPIRLPSSAETAIYAVVLDPLDGSSNIDYAVSVGTIFGVYRRRTPLQNLGGMEDLLQRPAELAAAGYAVYGSSTILVLSLGQDVNGFTLDPALGEFLLSHPDIKVPPGGKVLSVNTANRGAWTPEIERAVAAFERPDGGRPARSLRYVGSLVADAHRTLLGGGLFLYPADRIHPRGKLRLLYEAGPLAFVFERAGGRADSGAGPILELAPEALHDRTPLILGGRTDVSDFLALAHPEGHEAGAR